MSKPSNVHELPELAERSGLGGGLVRRTVLVTLGSVALLAAAALTVLLLFQVEITVDAYGVLEPRDVWRVHSFAAGVVHQLRAISGTPIERGEVLGRLDSFALESELVRLSLEAKHKRHMAETPRGEMELLEQTIRTVEERLRRLTLIAPASGIVLTEELDRLIGEHVQQGQLLFEIGSAEAWKAVLEIPEREIDPIRVGDRVKLTVPALADLGAWIPEDLPATVTFIGSGPTASSTPSRSFYRVYAELDVGAVDAGRRARFRRGMTVEARVVTRSARAIDLMVRHLRRQVGIDG